MRALEKEGINKVALVVFEKIKLATISGRILDLRFVMILYTEIKIFVT